MSSRNRLSLSVLTAMSPARRLPLQPAIRRGSDTHHSALLGGPEALPEVVSCRLDVRRIVMQADVAEDL
jgi:hypothetical protein